MPESEYSNPEVPHEVNVSERTPLRDFLRLSIGLGLIVVIVAGILFFTARFWASYIPFRYEERLTDFEFEKGNRHFCAMEGARTLQMLADDLAGNMALPVGMRIRTHFINSDEPNAFATLGGHIVISRGLVENIHSENALAMVIAHEIGHIKHRDPIVSLGGGVAVGLVFSALLGESNSGALVSGVIGMTQMSFSRNQEERADREALAALQARYGHTDGADEFFEYIVREHSKKSRMPTFVSTHPSPQSRLDAIHATFADEPHPLQPLSESIQQLLLCQ